jgi:hypothetical protein
LNVSSFSFAFPTETPSAIGSFGSSELPVCIATEFDFFYFYLIFSNFNVTIFKGATPEVDAPKVEPLAVYTGEEDEEKVFSVSNIIIY